MVSAKRGTTRSIAPQTLQLPSIPRQIDPDGVPDQPAISPAVPPDYKAVIIPSAALPVSILPGSPTGEVIALRPPRKRRGANARIYRMVLGGFAIVLAVSLLTFAPLGRVVTSGSANWLAMAASYAFPTPTPTATPPPAAKLPSHPAASDAGSFICVALPLARLAQQEMLQAGMTHPWPHPWHVSLMLAQWGIEQGWHIPGYTGYNWGNVGAIPGYPTVGGLNVWGSPSAFAYAYTAQQGVEEYVSVAHNGYYDNVTANWGNGTRAQAYALGSSPWDAAHYNNGGGPGSSLIAVINSFNLYRFDTPNITC
jgi:hypothetical protein